MNQGFGQTKTDWIQEGRPTPGGKNTGERFEEYFSMKGSPKRQVSLIFNHSGIDQRGVSKHEAKEAAREGGAKTWADLGQKLGIHSHRTADAYRETWRRCFIHARETSGLKDLTRIEASHVKEYLSDVIERGVSRATYGQYAAALGKLENALKGWAAATGANREYDLRSGIEANKNEAKSLKKFEGSRAYERPNEVPQNIMRADHQLAAKMQMEGGSRVNEIGLIRAEQLRPGFKFEAQGKGGKKLNPQLSEATWRELKAHIDRHGEFKIDHDDYRSSLKLAAHESSQQYNGSHGLRWNYAQRRMQELAAQKVDHYVALATVSKEMGHERPDITQHYLR